MGHAANNAIRRGHCGLSANLVNAIRTPRERPEIWKTVRIFKNIALVWLAAGAVAGCLAGSRAAPLAPDMRKWIDERGRTSCTSLQPRYRIAAGVRTSLGLPRYRAAVLREMSGAGAPAMGYDRALALSGRTAQLLDSEIRRRCPEQRIEGREDIVYVPQQS